VNNLSRRAGSSDQEQLKEGYILILHFKNYFYFVLSWSKHFVFDDSPSLFIRFERYLSACKKYNNRFKIIVGVKLKKNNFRHIFVIFRQICHF